MLEALISIDQVLTLGINEAHSASADSLMTLISEKRTWIPLYLGLILLINKIFGWKRALLIVGFVALNVALTDQISVFFKESFLRLRPCHDRRSLTSCTFRMAVVVNMASYLPTLRTLWAWPSSSPSFFRTDGSRFLCLPLPLSMAIQGSTWGSISSLMYSEVLYSEH